MGRRSSIERLDPRVREAVDAAVRRGATIDEIVGLIREAGAAASRSAVGRYVRRSRLQMERYRQAREVARAWVGRLEEEPDGDVGKLLTEMLRTVAWQQLADMGDGEASPSDVALLARALKDLAQADKAAAERVLRIRREVARQAAEAAEEVGRAEGLSAGTVEAIKRRILGLEDAA